ATAPDGAPRAVGRVRTRIHERRRPAANDRSTAARLLIRVLPAAYGPGDTFGPVELYVHPDLAALSFLLGTWRGSGRGEYPTIDPFPYDRGVVAEHVGEPFWLYGHSSWSPDDRKPLLLGRGSRGPGCAP